MSDQRKRLLSYEERKLAFRRRVRVQNALTGVINSVFLGMVILSGVVAKMYFF